LCATIVYESLSPSDNSDMPVWPPGNEMREAASIPSVMPSAPAKPGARGHCSQVSRREHPRHRAAPPTHAPLPRLIPGQSYLALYAARNLLPVCLLVRLSRACSVARGSSRTLRPGEFRGADPSFVACSPVRPQDFIAYNRASSPTRRWRTSSRGNRTHTAAAAMCALYRQADVVCAARSARHVAADGPPDPTQNWFPSNVAISRANAAARQAGGGEARHHQAHISPNRKAVC